MESEDASDEWIKENLGKSLSIVRNAGIDNINAPEKVPLVIEVMHERYKLHLQRNAQPDATQSNDQSAAQNNNQSDTPQIADQAGTGFNF